MKIVKYDINKGIPSDYAEIEIETVNKIIYCKIVLLQKESKMNRLLIKYGPMIGMLGVIGCATGDNTVGVLCTLSEYATLLLGEQAGVVGGVLQTICGLIGT